MARFVHLVRHGEVSNPDNVVYDSLPGFGLSAFGTLQAKAVSRFLGSQPIIAVWSSPLQRALETAAPIAERCGVPVSVEPDLTEWTLLSRWAGCRWDDLEDVHAGELPAYLDHPVSLPFADESLEALAQRMTQAISSINQRYEVGDVVIVSHQDPIQAARLSFTGRALAGLHSDKPTHASAITLAPGGTWREISSWAPELERDDSTNEL